MSGPMPINPFTGTIFKIFTFFSLGFTFHGDLTVGIVVKNFANERMNSDVQGLCRRFAWIVLRDSGLLHGC